MKILSRLLLCVLPPILAVIIAGSIIILQISNSGVAQQERDFLLFKARQLEGYIINQWNLLVEFRLFYEQDLIRSAQGAVANYASGLVTTREDADDTRLLDRIVEDDEGLNAGEIIFALVRPRDGRPSSVAFSTDETLVISPEEAEALLQRGENGDGIVNFAIETFGGTERAYTSFAFEQFNWVVYVSESVRAFQRTQSVIRGISLIVIALVTIVATLIIIVLARTITRPLTAMSKSTKVIINDIPEIKERLPVIYNDENGLLAQNFNSVFTALDRNYEELKKYTYDNIVIQKREARVKNIFQKYVPQQLIDRYIQRPESLLQSENRDVAVFFMDIRNFTSMSEAMSANDVVRMLNGFFDIVVAQITEHGGHVDKYIGDAIMAVFGAPVQSDNDPLAAVNTALAIHKELIALNASPAFEEFPEINIGIGIHYGSAVVGNVGCDTKIEYTAIGDTVNLASRVESLCKQYKQSLLISGSVVDGVKNARPPDQAIRFVDRIAVKGKTSATNIYTVIGRASIDAEALKLYGSAIQSYYKRDFKAAITHLKQAAKRAPDDYLISLFLERAEQMQHANVDESWDGIRVMQTK